MRAGGDAGTPIVVADPDAPAAQAFAAIAQKLAAGISVLNVNRPRERMFQADPDLAIMG